MVPLHDNEK